MTGDRDDDALDPRLEHEVRDALRRRDPGAAPLALRERVLDVPDATSRLPHAIDARRRLSTVLGIAATILVTVVALGAIGGLAKPGMVAASPAAASSALATPNPSAVPLAFDPTLDGPGISSTPEGSPGGVVVLALLALGGWAAALRGRRRLLPLAPALALVGYGIVAVNLPVDLRVTGWAPGLAIRAAAMPPGATEVLWYEVAPAGGRFSVGLDLIAVDSVPVTIDGIVEPNGVDSPYLVTWRAVWLDEQIGGGSTGPGSPFAPFELRQGDQMIWLVGQASACAVGPTFDGATSGSMGFDEQNSVDIRVTVLGWPRVVHLELPMRLLEPTSNPCPPDTVGLPGTPPPSPAVSPSPAPSAP